VQHIFSNTNKNLVQDLSQQTSGLLQLFTEQTAVTNPISTSLTPNQRHTLLFNVQQPFEVPMEEFDTEWWPL
ncbi:12975_t:CDS:1, partial [Gigaspora margarita]